MLCAVELASGGLSRLPQVYQALLQLLETHLVLASINNDQDMCSNARTQPQSPCTTAAPRWQAPRPLKPASKTSAN